MKMTKEDILEEVQRRRETLVYHLQQSPIQAGVSAWDAFDSGDYLLVGYCVTECRELACEMMGWTCDQQETGRHTSVGDVVITPNGVPHLLLEIGTPNIWGKID